MHYVLRQRVKLVLQAGVMSVLVKIEQSAFQSVFVSLRPLAHQLLRCEQCRRGSGCLRNAIVQRAVSWEINTQPRQAALNVVTQNSIRTSTFRLAVRCIPLCEFPRTAPIVPTPNGHRRGSCRCSWIDGSTHSFLKSLANCKDNIVRCADNNDTSSIERTAQDASG